MSEFFGRIAATYKNTMDQGCSELLGIAEGLLADKQLNDSEIGFLQRWLQRHEAVRSEWPGDLIYGHVQTVLADGVVTSAERDTLISVLTRLHGGALSDLAAQPAVNELALDDVDRVEFADHRFCLTGEFGLGPRAHCASLIEGRGGLISKNVTMDLGYLVVGGLGSEEWKHGGHGTKIKKAIDYKRKGTPILIVHERVLQRSLQAAA